MPGPAIDVSLSCPKWRAALDGPVALCRRAVRAALAAGGIAPVAMGALEISVVLGDDDMLAALNRTWRRRAGPTNVLSFAAATPQQVAVADADRPLLLGDVVIAFETTAREAAAASRPLADHLAHLVVHGALHLLGHDHVAANDAAAMEALEIAALAAMGIDDPQAGTPVAVAGR
jgi:probable rRNA maturation factor